jgi:serine/threonine protein kinase
MSLEPAARGYVDATSPSLCVHLPTSPQLQVALKALSLRGLRDWKQLELFQREAVVLQGLAHAGIPAYIDYFEEDTASDRAFYIVQASGLGFG